MAQYTLTGPDGRKVTISAPDDAPEDQIRAKLSQVKENWGKLPASPQQDDGLSPLDRQMSERVAKEGVGDAATRVFNKGMPWGSFLDEATAGIKSVLPESFGGMPYDQAVALERARDRAAEQQYDGWGGTALKVGGALASAPFLPVAKAFQGSTLLPTMGNAAVTGAGYGAAYGAGESEGGGRIENTIKGGAVGAAVGGALAPVARGIGNSIEYVRNNRSAAPGPLANYDRTAVRNVLGDFKADTMTPAMYGQKAGALGEQGMLADMGENMLLTTNALANTPGKQMQVVRDRLTERQGEAPRRVYDLLNSELGVPQDIPSYMRAQKASYQQKAKPFYDAFYNTDVDMTPEIRQVLSRVPKSAFSEAERLARADGIKQLFKIKYVNDPMTAMTGVQGSQAVRQIKGVEYDYLKRAIDDMAGTAEKGSNEERIFSNLARSLRTEVDNAISPGAPDQSPWALARQIFGEGAQGREGVEIGQQVFKGQGMRPYDLKEELRGASQYKQEGIKIGARDELNSRMGRAATNFGPKGDATARRALNSEFSRQNIEQVAGPGPAQRISKGIDAENAFADTYNEVAANSATAKRQAAQRKLPMTSEKPVADSSPTTVGALAVLGAKKILNVITSGALNERAERIMLDQAKMLTARGASRNAIAQSLMQMANSRNLSAAQKDAVVRVLNQLARGAVAPSAEAVTSQRPNP